MEQLEKNLLLKLLVLTHESELREANLDMQKKLDDTGEYNVGIYSFTSQHDHEMYRCINLP